jgi:hypothetical protein
MADGVNQDFSIYAGDDQNIAVTIKNRDGSNMNITNVTELQWVIKRFSLSADPIITKLLSEAEIIKTDATNGGARIVLLSADTQSVYPGPYYHELRVSDENGFISTVMTGTVTILPAEEMS